MVVVVTSGRWYTCTREFVCARSHAMTATTSTLKTVTARRLCCGSTSLGFLWVVSKREVKDRASLVVRLIFELISMKDLRTRYVIIVDTSIRRVAWAKARYRLLLLLAVLPPLAVLLAPPRRAFHPHASRALNVFRIPRASEA